MSVKYKAKLIKVQLSKDQKQKVASIFNNLRESCNLYLEECSLCYNALGGIPDYRYFDKKINNEISKVRPWLTRGEVSSKARKEYLKQVWQAFKRLIKKGKEVYFKSKKNEDINSLFFEKTGIRFVDDNKHLWIPIIHTIKLKEVGYLTEEDIPNISSGRLIKTKFKDEYFISLLIKQEKNTVYDYQDFFEYQGGLGIDLNIQNYMVLYGKFTEYIENPNLTSKSVRKSWYKIKNISRGINLKYEFRKGGTTTTHEDKKANINKLRAKLRKYYKHISNAIKDFINKKIFYITVRTKPAFIVIEDLAVQELLQKDSYMHKLHHNMQFAMFRYLRERLIQKCDDLGIEVRLADKYFASSKTCFNCGHKKKKLSLSDRVYTCKKCGISIDRDLNAAKNLYNLKDYRILTHNENRIAVGYTGTIDLAEMLGN